LIQKYHDIKLDQPGTTLPWIETMTVTSTAESFDSDPALANDDLKRELAFYKQALTSVLVARKQCKDAGVPFSRPSDYFAEMVKSDAHMQRVRASLSEEAEGIKASEEAKALRHQKKFGKKVQVEKLRERQMAKKAEIDKVNVGKKKKGSNTGLDDDVAPKGDKKGEKRPRDWDVSVEKDEQTGNKRAKENHKRVGKDAKFGFGGKKRHGKSNTAESTNMEGGGKGTGGYSASKMKASKSVRPGKNKRMHNRSK
jgi:rRNA-processing protein EBP2